MPNRRAYWGAWSDQLPGVGFQEVSMKIEVIITGVSHEDVVIDGDIWMIE